MDINAINQLNGFDTSAAQTDSATLGDDFDDFLLLLTTQLQNQDPLQPMETAEFTNQLVQFSNVEQNIKGNGYLEQLVASTGSNQNTAALAYLGTDVTAEGNRVLLKDGESVFQYLSSQDYEAVSVNIESLDGQLLRTIEAPNEQGLHTVEWNGTDADGSPLNDGIYRVRVLANDGSDNPQTLSTIVSGPVESVGTENGEIMVTVNGIPVPQSSIISVNTPQ